MSLNDSVLEGDRDFFITMSKEKRMTKGKKCLKNKEYIKINV